MGHPSADWGLIIIWKASRLRWTKLKINSCKCKQCEYNKSDSQCRNQYVLPFSLAFPIKTKEIIPTISKIAYKHYIRALARWPKDTLRPECQFQDVMRKRLDRRFLPTSSPESQSAATAVANSAVDERLELEQANILYSLLENRYSRKVCAPRRQTVGNWLLTRWVSIQLLVLS